MTWEAIGTIGGLVLTLLSGLNIYVSMKTRTAVDELKIYCLETFARKDDFMQSIGPVRQAVQYSQSAERIITKTR